MPDFWTPIFSLLVGGLVTHLGQTWISKRATDIAEINEHIAEITKIEADAITYWCFDPACDGGDVKQRELEARLKGVISVTGIFRERARALLGDEYQSYIEQDGALYDAVSGGTFEQAGRARDLNRVIEIMELCHKQRQLLRRARTKLHWFR